MPNGKPSKSYIYIHIFILYYMILIYYIILDQIILYYTILYYIIVYYIIIIIYHNRLKSNPIWATLQTIPNLSDLLTGNDWDHSLSLTLWSAWKSNLFHLSVPKLVSKAKQNPSCVWEICQALFGSICYQGRSLRQQRSGHCTAVGCCLSNLQTTRQGHLQAAYIICNYTDMITMSVTCIVY